MKIVLDVDDFSPVKPGLDTLLKLKEHFPDFKITCFTPALDQALPAGKLTEAKIKEWVDVIKQFPWIEIAPHGLLHLENEMNLEKVAAEKVITAVEQVFKKLEFPYTKVWKSPYWVSSRDTLRVLRDKKYTVAVDKNQPLPKIHGLNVYVYDESIHNPLPDQEVVKWHGHIGGTFYNDISQCLENLMTMPEDVEFLTISEYLDGYGPVKIKNN